MDGARAADVVLQLLWHTCRRCGNGLATDDDLANLNFALDAPMSKLKYSIVQFDVPVAF